VRRLQQGGYEPVLNKTRWLIAKRPENLTEKQRPRLRELLQYNLQSVRAYLLREDFQQLWEYVSPAWAHKFLTEWIRKAMLSKIEPIKQAARFAATRDSSSTGSSQGNAIHAESWKP
jgi:transposase